MDTKAIEDARKAIEAGNEALARRLLAELLRRTPQNAEGWFLMSFVVPQEQAIESLERAIRLNAEYREAEERLAELTAILPPPPPVEPEDQEITPSIEEAEISEKDWQGLLDSEDSQDKQQELHLPESADEVVLLDFASSQAAPIREVDSGVIADSWQRIADDDHIPLVSEEQPLKIKLESDLDVTEAEDAIGQTERQTLAEKEVLTDAAAGLGDTQTQDVESGKRKVMETATITTEFPQSTPSIEKKPQKQKTWLGKGILVIAGGFVLMFLVIIGLLGWFYFYGPCGVIKVSETSQHLEQIKTRWDSTLRVVMSASSLVIAQPLQDLNKIRLELIDYEVPKCMQPVKSSLEQSMFATIEAYVHLLQYESDAEINARLLKAAQFREEYQRGIQQIQKCAPLCP